MSKRDWEVNLNHILQSWTQLRFDLKESWYHTQTLLQSLLPPSSKLMSHGIDWMFTWHLCQKHPFTNLTGVNLASKRHCTYNMENRTIYHQLNALSKRADWQGTKSNIAHTKWCLPNKSQPIFIWNAKRVFSTHQTKWNCRERRLSLCVFYSSRISTFFPSRNPDLNTFTRLSGSPLFIYLIERFL